MATTNAINANSTGLVKHDGAGTFSAETVTQYQTLVGAASNGISGVSVGSSGQILTSNGASSNPTFQDAPTGYITVQQVRNTSTAQTGTTQNIPDDNTIPQNTEGVEYLTASITPTSSSNVLIIEFNSWGGIASGTANGSGIALFQDSTANALDGFRWTFSSNVFGEGCNIRYIMTAGTTSSTTFKIRFGRSSSASTTCYLNRRGSEATFGGVAMATLTITEMAV